MCGRKTRRVELWFRAAFGEGSFKGESVEMWDACAPHSAHRRESGGPAVSRRWIPAFAAVSGDWSAFAYESRRPADGYARG